jgi:hypothetical protein
MENETDPYVKRIVNFYFSPTWLSIFTIFYLVFFAYFVFFYSYNIILAFKFVWHTIAISKSQFGLPYLLWGVTFTISLIAPFFVSLYALVIPYEISEKGWSKDKKALAIALLSLVVILIVVIMDNILGYAAKQGPVIDFVIQNNLHLLSR